MQEITGSSPVVSAKKGPDFLRNQVLFFCLRVNTSALKFRSTSTAIGSDQSASLPPAAHCEVFLSCLVLLLELPVYKFPDLSVQSFRTRFAVFFQGKVSAPVRLAVSSK